MAANLNVWSLEPIPDFETEALFLEISYRENLFPFQILGTTFLVSVWCRNSPTAAGDDHTVQDEEPPTVYYDEEKEQETPGNYTNVVAKSAI